MVEKRVTGIQSKKCEFGREVRNTSEL